jgi:hypothetical protein
MIMKERSIREHFWGLRTQSEKTRGSQTGNCIAERKEQHHGAASHQSKNHGPEVRFYIQKIQTNGELFHRKKEKLRSALHRE